MASYKTNDFRKGLKVQIDGEPYLMIEMNFVKPGKGNALYKCKLRNLIRNTVLDRTYKGGDSLEAADVEETDVQFLYRQGDTFVFMDNKTYEQYELTAEQVDESWKYLKESMPCSMILYNGSPITMTPPNHGHGGSTPTVAYGSTVTTSPPAKRGAAPGQVPTPGC